MVMVWRKLPILLNGIKPALFFVMRVKQNEPEREKNRFPKNFFILQCEQHLRSTITLSRSIKTDSDDEPACFFCHDTTGNLAKVETMSLDSRVRRIAEELRGTKLLATLSGGDVVAIDAQNHLRCLAAFYGRGRSRKRRSNEAPHHINAETLAFTEVVSCIKKYGQIGEDLNVFQLSDIKNYIATSCKKMTCKETSKSYSSA